MESIGDLNDHYPSCWHQGSFPKIKIGPALEWLSSLDPGLKPLAIFSPMVRPFISSKSTCWNYKFRGHILGFSIKKRWSISRPPFRFIRFEQIWLDQIDPDSLLYSKL